MSRSMRKHAESLIGKAVIVYHIEGVTYYGVLHSITKEGIYLQNCHLLDQIAAHDKSTDIELAVADNDTLDLRQVFFPFFFLPFAVLTGVAAANLARPPYYGYGYGPGYYPYGYGAGYPPYW